MKWDIDVLRQCYCPQTLLGLHCESPKALTFNATCCITKAEYFILIYVKSEGKEVFTTP